MVFPARAIPVAIASSKLFLDDATISIVLATLMCPLLFCPAEAGGQTLTPVGEVSQKVDDRATPQRSPQGLTDDPAVRQYLVVRSRK